MESDVKRVYELLGSASERAKWVGGRLGKVGSFSPVLLPHVIGQVRYGRGRKGKYKCWKQSLAYAEPSIYIYIYIYMFIYLFVDIYIYIYIHT